MEKVRPFAFGILIVLVCLSFSSCLLPSRFDKGASRLTNTREIGTTTPVALNARQQEICEEMGLPTVFEKLTYQQQKCIVRIEELLQYLDNKYNTTFNYRGYYEAFAPVYQKEKLEAYTDDTGEFEYTTLTVDDDGSFADDYLFQLVKPIVRYDFIEYMQKKLGREFKVYGIRGKTEIEDVSSINKETLSGTTVVSCTAYVEQSDDLDVTETGTAIADWYNSLGIYGNTNVIAVNQGTLKDINYDNYDSVKLDQHLSNYLMCEVDSSGGYEID